ncbi:S8 family peptidase [Lysobacter korlensis]|uniref:S8 family peptidase n=1 Tax=Lysobacter korlensis TaxID=553636 RepID=A0ABV6RMH3_9GAMM
MTELPPAGPSRDPDPAGTAPDRESVSPLPDSDATRGDRFTPEVLDSTTIAIPLLQVIKHEAEAARTQEDYTPPILDVMIDLNLEYPDGREEAREQVVRLIEEAIAKDGVDKEAQGIDRVSPVGNQYVVAQLEPHVISTLARFDREHHREGPRRVKRGAIFRIWPDFEVRKLTDKSVSTVKADAARVSFSAFGEGIVWAVVDSGIDATHPHFATYENLKLKQPLRHHDFTGRADTGETGDEGTALTDDFGHGTHVAGIIAGATYTEGSAPAAGSGGASTGSSIPTVEHIHAMAKRRDEDGETTYVPLELTSITGMAPKCKLVSLKVLDEKGVGRVSRIVAALQEVQRVNAYGRNIQIHGVNLSVGYEFQPEWFACGQSPLCVEVDLLVRSGVIVVVAAGNTGYGYNRDQSKGAVAAGLDLTINDPGNADRAITVGSTHREMPHVYGVSYFSSKGPTGDGRMKPDLVAPGEKIMSCAAGAPKAAAMTSAHVEECEYVEDSGTSMAAPHVSGVIAAFLSVRHEFVGKTDEVKHIFLSTATDLKRDRNFQGYGLVDLMRAIQSV